ncbi:hypothetical protein TRICI_001145 [Trichomonascus ciferrii]|uniref:FHA domain-containing protein n=1 Tax=Trichomonascus ciferrii TaxID=44093 RepID=A0A642VAS0_9ASCO|nr:hypothetical protein TRICI_001145 [Trichomonascus ciferrii]
MYAIGRSTKNDVIVTSKSVSRFHGDITIGAVQPDAYKHASQKTKITFHDKSPKGVDVNGKRYDGGSTFDLDVLRNDVFKLKLAHSTEYVEIKWQPVVITYVTGVTGRAHEQLTQELRGYLEPMDIKLVPALHHATTHFLNLSNKGWSNKTLHALVRLIPVVTMDFVKALHENANGLETNFWLKFPKSSDFLPNFDQRYEVNEKRRECFQGLKFIFLDPVQRDTFVSIITTGGGKCLYLEKEKYDLPMSLHDGVQNIIRYVESNGDKVLLMKLPDPKNLTDLENERFERQVKAATALGIELVKETDVFDSIVQCSFEGLWTKTKRKATKRTSTAKSASSRGSIESFLSKPLKKEEDDDDDLLDFEPIPAKNKTAVTREPASDDLYDFEPIPTKSKAKKSTKEAHDSVLDADLEQEAENNDKNDGNDDDDIFNFEPIPSKRRLQEQSAKTAKRQKTASPPPLAEKSPSPVPGLEEEIMGEQSEKEAPAEPIEPEPSAQEEEAAEDDEYIPRLRDLALVECTMPTRRSVAIPQVAEQMTYNGRPNFKKFRRKGKPLSTTNQKSAKIDLVEASQDSARKAQEIQTMFTDFSPKKKRPKSSNTPQPPSKRAKTETLAISSDDDENLFVAPPDSQYIESDDDEPEIVETSSHTQTGTRESNTAPANVDSDDDDDDVYEFEFSRD